MAIEIVDLPYLPIENGGSFHSYVSLREGISTGMNGFWNISTGMEVLDFGMINNTVDGRNSAPVDKR